MSLSLDIAWSPLYLSATLLTLTSHSANVSVSAPIDLSRVRDLFVQPQRVAESNFLRREVATRMLERLALVRLNAKNVLDAGCGAGADLPALQKQYPQSRIIGLDGSYPMLAMAYRQQRAASSILNRLIAQWLPSIDTLGHKRDADLVGGNFANLPFAANTFDLVWSNLALHWHSQPDRVFAEWRRILRTEGLLMFSCFGPDTFKQLRTAFEQSSVDGIVNSVDTRVLPFVDMHDFGDMLITAGFSTPVIDMETITVTYESVSRLLADVRAWGGNPLATRPRGLQGRNTWHRMRRSFEAMRDTNGKIPLTFEIIYGHAFRPVPQTISNGESIIRFDPRPRR